MNIMIIDDNSELSELIKIAAEMANAFPTVLLESPKIKDMDIHEYGLIFLDVFMPDMDGIEVLMYLSDKGFKGQIILMSGGSDTAMQAAGQLAKGLKLNVVKSIDKPFRVKDIIKLIESV